MSKTDLERRATRGQIVDAADRLFYQQGYEHTSFSDIAKAVRISRGNFYYHFQSKEEILKAVIQERLAATRRMFEQWELESREAADRIRRFIHILVENRSQIQRHGCPVGTLCTELTKLDLASQVEAKQVFVLFRAWLGRQFALLGRARDADVLAMHLLARSQGVATLANAFRDEQFIRQEVEQMCDWLRSCAEDVRGKRKPRTSERTGFANRTR